MKKIGTAIIILILSSNLVYSQKYTAVKLLEKKQAVILISGRNITYYKLSKRNTLDFSVKGADKLIIYSRKRIDNKDKPDPYTISYKFDDSQETDYKSEKIKIDLKTLYIDKTIKKTPSVFYRKIVKVPENTDNLKLLLKESNDDVDISVIVYYKTKKKKPTPINYIERIVIKTGKRYEYYKLNSLIPTIIKIDKPGKLIVYTRKRLSKHGKKGYSFSYKDKNANIKTINVSKTESSNESLYKSFNIYNKPSGYHKTVINIPENYGELTFSSDFPVDARFIFLKAKINSDWNKISPINKNETVSLQYKKTKTVRKYYRITEKETFTFNVVGPSKIKIFTRGEHSYDMHSNNDYEIVLKEGSEVINTYKLSCFRSSQVEYKDNDEMIPGTLDRIYIDVPKGKHSYTLNVNNNNKTALIRVHTRQ